MKLYRPLIFILIVFLKTETLLSDNYLFNVNNIEVKKKDKITNIQLADKAIKKGFSSLLSKILLNDDISKLSDLNFSSIKQLVTYYQVADISEEKKTEGLLNFSITFDKDKIHNLFYQRGISYSEIIDKELYILPILLKKNEIFVFNNNYFYEKWAKIKQDDLIEFILPLENIEIIQNINKNKNNLISLNLNNLFKEYINKNFAIILIEDNNSFSEKIFIKASIQGKIISKSFNIKNEQKNREKFYENIIISSKKELIDMVKSKNLIDIRTPSFINARLNLNKKSNYVKLSEKIISIDSIENIYVQEFNKDYMELRIKYLGKLDKIINQLKKESIKLGLVNDRWVITTL